MVEASEPVERDQAAVLGGHHRVHLELGEAEAVRRLEPGPALGEPRERERELREPLLGKPGAPARAEPPGERGVDEGPAQGPQGPALGEAAGGEHRAGLLGAEGPQQGLGVEPAHAEDDDRAEGGVVAEGGQHLAAGPRPEPDPLHDERAREPRPGRALPGGGQHPRHRVPDRGGLVPAGDDAAHVALVEKVGRGDLDDRLLRAEGGAERVVDACRALDQAVPGDGDPPEARIS